MYKPRSALSSNDHSQCVFLARKRRFPMFTPCNTSLVNPRTALRVVDGMWARPGDQNGFRDCRNAIGQRRRSLRLSRQKQIPKHFVWIRIACVDAQAGCEGRNGQALRDSLEPLPANPGRQLGLHLIVPDRSGRPCRRPCVHDRNINRNAVSVRGGTLSQSPRPAGQPRRGRQNGQRDTPGTSRNTRRNSQAPHAFQAYNRDQYLLVAYFVCFIPSRRGCHLASPARQCRTTWPRKSNHG